MGHTPNITKEGVEVKAGQIWRDLDKRSNGRRCKVIEVKDGKAHMRLATKFGVVSKRTTKVSISRMHRSSTGWAIETDV